MNGPYSENAHDASFDGEDAEGYGVLCRDNLIYLPFARHLADEDAEGELKAA